MDIVSGVSYAIAGLELGTYALKSLMVRMSPCSDDPCEKATKMLCLPFPLDIIAQEYHFRKHPRCLDNGGFSCLEEKVTA